MKTTMKKNKRKNKIVVKEKGRDHLIKCLLTEFSPGRTGKYLALDHGARHDLGPNIFRTALALSQ